MLGPGFRPSYQKGAQGSVIRNYVEVELPQSVDTPLRGVTTPRYSFRFAGLRSADARDRNANGQDFLAMRYCPDSFLFALCDGVGGSFFGDLAAAFLGRSLLDWLEDSNGLPDEQSLHRHLAAITASASRQVESICIPSDTAPMIASVLESKRQMGSEAMFVAGRFDLDTPRPGCGQVWLAWMGDVRLKVLLGGSFRMASPAGPESTKQRWSTRRGPVEGLPEVWSAEIREDEDFAFQTYSDGLKSLDREGGYLPDDRVAVMVHEARDGPESDDTTLLEFHLGSRPLPGHFGS